MSDQILDCQKYTKPDSSIDYWVFKYHIEKSGAANEFCITIKASEMSDPTSASEAKTKANNSAKAIKDNWIVIVPPTPTDVITNEGAVTL